MLKHLASAILGNNRLFWECIVWRAVLLMAHAYWRATQPAPVVNASARNTTAWSGVWTRQAEVPAPWRDYTAYFTTNRTKCDWRTGREPKLLLSSHLRVYNSSWHCNRSLFGGCISSVAGVMPPHVGFLSSKQMWRSRYYNVVLVHGGCCCVIADRCFAGCLRLVFSCGWVFFSDWGVKALYFHAARSQQETSEGVGLARGPDPSLSDIC